MKSARIPWKCPKCGRRFAKRNQWHSCQARSVGDHFRGKNPQLRKLYDALMKRLRGLGPLRVDAVKSSINLVSKHHFGGIAVRKDHLRLGFLQDELIEDPRIVRSERVGPNRIGHHVLLRSVEDLDDRLFGWLQKAYELQSR